MTVSEFPSDQDLEFIKLFKPKEYRQAIKKWLHSTGKKDNMLAYNVQWAIKLAFNLANNGSYITDVQEIRDLINRV